MAKNQKYHTMAAKSKVLGKQCIYKKLQNDHHLIQHGQTITGTKNLNPISFFLTITLLLSCLPMPVQAFEPGFISVLENTTVAAGRSTQFTCVVKHLGGHKVAWLRSDTKAILAVHTNRITNNPRMSVIHNGHNSWTLKLTDVQRNDSGIYMCQINTDPMIHQIAFLNVVEAPDILYNQTSNDTVVAEGSKLHLHCEAQGYPEPRIIWKREDGYKISIRNNGRTRRVDTFNGEDLIIRRLTRADMGAYLCIASNGIPSPVSKRIMVGVEFNPLVKTEKRVYEAPLGANITMTCIIESSPKSINSWMKQLRDGTWVHINPGNTRRSRILASDVQDRKVSYVNVFKIFIGDLREIDFGNYSCNARSSLKTFSETIYLKKLDIPTPAPQITTTPKESNDVKWVLSDRHKKKGKSMITTEKLSRDTITPLPPNSYHFENEVVAGNDVDVSYFDGIYSHKNQVKQNNGLYSDGGFFSRSSQSMLNALNVLISIALLMITLTLL